MSNLKRMAGDKLDERFGDGFTDRVKGDGIQEKTKQGASKRELLAEFRVRPDGVSVDDKIKEYQTLADSGQRFNKKAKDYLTSHGVTFSSKAKPDPITDNPEETPTSNPTPTSSPDSPAQVINPGNPGDTDGMNVNINQDNDIYNNINGNNNTVSNNQDNSISINSARQRSTSDFKNMWMKNFFN